MKSMEISAPQILSILISTSRYYWSDSRSILDESVIVSLSPLMKWLTLNTYESDMSKIREVNCETVLSAFPLSIEGTALSHSPFKWEITANYRSTIGLSICL